VKTSGWRLPRYPETDTVGVVAVAAADAE